MIKTLFWVFGILLTVGGALFALQATGGEVQAGGADAVLRFNEFIGVQRPFTGSDNPVRGVNGGGLPWVLHEGGARLHADGTLSVRVRGLVFDPNDPIVVSRDRDGINTVGNFRAILSCQTGTDPDTFANFSTATFSASIPGGDARVENAALSPLSGVPLPDPCNVPIVFVTSPGLSWFALSGVK